MAEGKDKKVFDVAKPGSSKPDIGSKPMIVGHKSMAGDPMMKPETDQKDHIDEQTEAAPPSESSRKLTPMSEELKEKSADLDKKNEPKESSDTEEFDVPDESDKSEVKDKAKKLDPVAEEMEREDKLQKIITSKKYNVKIKESKSWSFKKFLIGFVMLALLTFIGLFVLIDTNTIKSDIDLPIRIFGSEEAVINNEDTLLQEVTNETDSSETDEVESSINNNQLEQIKERDAERIEDIDRVYLKLEEFYSENGGYPDGNLTEETLPGISPEALLDVNGNSIAYTGGFITSTTEPVLSEDDNSEYLYVAYGCATPGAQNPVGATCEKYVLSTYLEEETGKMHEKKSLN